MRFGLTIPNFGDYGDPRVLAALAHEAEAAVAAGTLEVDDPWYGGTADFERCLAEVEAACAVLRAAGQRELVMIDFSHANSRKDHRRQIEVGHDVAAQIAGGEQRIGGVMIESHLEAGRQDLKPGQPLQRGVSITDACLGWDDSAALLHHLAGGVRQRRSLAARGSPR